MGRQGSQVGSVAGCRARGPGVLEIPEDFLKEVTPTGSAGATPRAGPDRVPRRPRPALE